MRYPEKIRRILYRSEATIDELLKRMFVYNRWYEYDILDLVWQDHVWLFLNFKNMSNLRILLPMPQPIIRVPRKLLHKGRKRNVV
jgi:hypothetical protein